MIYWMVRRSTRLACSPSAVIFGIFIAAGIVVYVYREVILRTIELALFATLTIALMTGVTALALQVIRYRRRVMAEIAGQGAAGQKTIVRQAEPELVAIPASAVQQPSTQASEQKVTGEADAMAAEAGYLDASEVELSMDKDGKLLVRDSRRR
jgi:hypothetical protein